MYRSEELQTIYRQSRKGILFQYRPSEEVSHVSYYKDWFFFYLEVCSLHDKAVGCVACRCTSWRNSVSARSVNMTAFRDVAPCSVVEVDWRFRFIALKMGAVRTLKRRSAWIKLHGAIYQKAVICRHSFAGLTEGDTFTLIVLAAVMRIYQSYRNINGLVRYWVLTVVKLIMLFKVVAPCGLTGSLVDQHRHSWNFFPQVSTTYSLLSG
jgi:hypothetical protein